MIYQTILAVFILTVVAKTPPVFNYTYQVSFVQTVKQRTTQYHVNGQLFYDPLKNRERVDRQNGQHNVFCNTVLPGVATPCQSLTVSGNRWLIFPQRAQCCLCCTSVHGCGILTPDWLRDSDYQGESAIDGVSYDKWHKKGSFTENYVYSTVDEKQLERRLDEGGSQITDYDLSTFEKKVFEDSIFAVPSYCNASKPTNCPLTSTCGMFRSGFYKFIMEN